jgi:hypothetical protein
MSEFDDLELLRDSELYHLHFEDVPADPPREIQDSPIASSRRTGRPAASDLP